MYKRLLVDARDYTALNVFVALCYAKLDYFDVSQEILAPYLAAHPDSMAAANLRACNQFKCAAGALRGGHGAVAAAALAVARGRSSGG